MKLLRVEISRKTYAVLSLLVPDDFPGIHLHQHAYEKTLRDIAKDVWANGEDGVEIEVEDVQHLTGAAAEQEAKEFKIIDACAAIDAVFEHPPTAPKT